jgi:hypothetical protein
MLWATGLNLAYGAIAVLVYLRVLESARVAGTLLSHND